MRPLLNPNAGSFPNFPPPDDLHCTSLFPLLFLNNTNPGVCLSRQLQGHCSRHLMWRRTQSSASQWPGLLAANETSGACVTWDMFFWTLGKRVKVLLPRLLKSGLSWIQVVMELEKRLLWREQWAVWWEDTGQRWGVPRRDGLAICPGVPVQWDRWREP